MRDEVEKEMNLNGIEFRRGMSGGGNQYLQPYLKQPLGWNPDKYPLVDYIHKYGWYIGNFPDLTEAEIVWLTEILNAI
jgi:CDP-6-deoxy-D-xylo-4-hexulose-3-dehydrase